MKNRIMASNSKTHLRQVIFLDLSYLLLIVIVLLPSCCFAADEDAGRDTITAAQPLRNAEYLSSANKIFRLRFFSPGTSGSIYLGIFYNLGPNERMLTRDPVWVANRDNPVPELFGSSLMIDPIDGLLKISYRGGSITVSSSISSGAAANNTSATILDNGNLVQRGLNPDGSINRTLWQSFDYPTDTLLPGMKLGINFRTGHKWSLTSWAGYHVPDSGSFTLGGDPNGSSQLMMRWQGNLYWTSGLWDKGSFNNTRIFGPRGDLNYTYISDENEKYLTFSRPGNFSWVKVSVKSDGVIEMNLGDVIVRYTVCSVSGHPRPGSGCVMEMLPKCRKVGLGFRERRGRNNSFGYSYDDNPKLSLFDCELKCRQNCSCVTFASTNDNGTGCQVFDRTMQFIPSESIPSTPVERYHTTVYFLDTGGATKWWIWLIAAVSGALILLLSILGYCILRNRRRKAKENTEGKLLLQELADTTTPPGQYSGRSDRLDKQMNQVRLFSFESLEMATNNFSTANKLGQGGFGSVYKGKLPSGQEIAIKRLSRSSGQGLTEFKNEILLIAKLQHDNLVKLLGCCLKRQEKILVYEYMPNRSLDFFLFDPCRRESLKWNNRMNIVEGVAQGLLYLHKYSRLKVIHRDLKASNILLDENMNPKISDFGMARIFGKQEAEANTNRIVGTYGYMSPEYAIKGVFSMKTDVFSFGVLLLEIVSGKKNHGCYHPERPLNLIGLAWEMWVEGRAIELMDPTLDDSIHRNKIIRCITVSLLCVKDDAVDRLSITDVISMLTNESLQLPEPKRPAFFIDTSTREDEKEAAFEKPCTNDLSISVMEGR